MKIVLVNSPGNLCWRTHSPQARNYEFQHVRKKEHLGHTSIVWTKIERLVTISVNLILSEERDQIVRGNLGPIEMQ